MKKRELEARFDGLIDALAGCPYAAVKGPAEGDYMIGHQDGQAIRKSILTAAREQQPARGDAVSFQRESSGGYSLHTPHDPAPGEQQTRETQEAFRRTNDAEHELGRYRSALIEIRRLFRDEPLIVKLADDVLKRGKQDG